MSMHWWQQNMKLVTIIGSCVSYAMAKIWVYPEICKSLSVKGEVSSFIDVVWTEVEEDAAYQKEADVSTS
jgi:hypothetical protein